MEWISNNIAAIANLFQAITILALAWEGMRELEKEREALQESFHNRVKETEIHAFTQGYNESTINLLSMLQVQQENSKN